MSNSDDGDSSKPMYGFIIGGWANRKSAIRKRNDNSLTPGSEQSVTFDTPDLCKCDEYRPFWISAINGVLMIGKGLIVGSSIQMTICSTAATCILLLQFLSPTIMGSLLIASCELVALSPGVVTQIPKKQEDGWEFYTKCYRYNGACLWCYF
ncbi:unnamed protein product [Mytilus coruscus]|uniref:Farnesoic acid O-methyl transferase domain-containing protein n=1 Tax=Mytilus coruscus TaxID=42192 RepID=A0A6J8ESW7_MYTCO|nr:unnamed protein product [Mytilus coruscus]